MPTLSVVVPIYKVEQYLERCVNSILYQDYKDLEVILVDDGSPDRCPEICDEFAKKDPRIKVIHKENGGLSSARNAGINVATGKYIAFVDSDDQWNKGMLKPLMKQVVESDAPMTLFRSLDLSETGELLERDDMCVFGVINQTVPAVKLYPVLIYMGNLYEHACTKILSLSFVRDNNLLFTQGILGEDTEWMFRLMRVIDRIQTSSIPLYLYTYNREGSITNTASTKSIRDLIYTINKSLNFYDKENNIVKDYELAHCSYLWSIALGLYTNVPKEYRKEIKKSLVETKTKLSLSSHPKAKKVGLIYNLFGFYFTAMILKFYMYLLKRNVVNKKKTLHE